MCRIRTSLSTLPTNLSSFSRTLRLPPRARASLADRCFSIGIVPYPSGKQRAIRGRSFRILFLRRGGNRSLGSPPAIRLQLRRCRPGWTAGSSPRLASSALPYSCFPDKSPRSEGKSPLVRRDVPRHECPEKHPMIRTGNPQRQSIPVPRSFEASELSSLPPLAIAKAHE